MSAESDAYGHVFTDDSRRDEQYRCLSAAHDPLPEERFDLIVARLVLQRLAERDAIMGPLVRALKPGG